jgi:peptide/nickel transport system substrate-binding protein
MFHPPLSRPLTSADIMASWQYFTTNVKNANKDVFGPIVDSITAPDDKTIVFKLKAPYAPFLNKLANPSYLWLMSQEAVNRKGIDPSTQAVGTGPFIYQEQTPTAITWKKNPNYWNKGIPYVDGAVLNIIPSTSTSPGNFASSSASAAPMSRPAGSVTLSGASVTTPKRNPPAGGK